MKPSALSLIVLSYLVSAGSMAQEIRLSMPMPPVREPVTGAPLKFDSTLTVTENNRRREVIESNLRSSASKVRAALAAARMRGPAESPMSPTSGPAPVVNALDLATVELESWQRILDKFNLESICGVLDESQDVELYKGDAGPSKAFVDTHQSAVGQIQWVADLGGRLGIGGNPGTVTGARTCSGTLIAQNLFLTAGHCFHIDPNGWITPRKNNVPLPPNELAPLMQVNFNYQVNAATRVVRSGVSFPIKKLIEFERGGLDYAIVEIGSDNTGALPAPRFKVAKMNAAALDSSNITFLTVIQHPDQKPKKIAAGVQKSLAQSYITYSDVDTLGGSSGAGILDHRGNLIGVHTNGGCARNGGFNSGVTLHAIGQHSQLVK